MILEMKNTISQIKVSGESLNSRKKHEESRISGLKHKGEEIDHPVKSNDFFKYIN